MVTRKMLVFMLLLTALASAADSGPAESTTAKSLICAGDEVLVDSVLVWVEPEGCWASQPAPEPVVAGPTLDVPPEDCASGHYRWTGVFLECASTDRMDLFKLQRTQYRLAFQACTVGVQVNSVISQRRTDCRKDGKRFDALEGLCVGALP